MDKHFAKEKTIVAVQCKAECAIAVVQALRQVPSATDG